MNIYSIKDHNRELILHISGDDSHPTAPTQVGHDHYTYDANGNPILVENDSLNTERRMYWDEDNRLMVLSDNGKTSRYTYNAAGERIVKSHGDLEGVYINGAPQGISFHETEDYTIYPAPIITVTKNRFTKHYFIGDKRVASKLGVGKFSNVYGIGGNNITAGQKDYAARMMQIEKQREEYYKQLGTPPGVPTMKGATADPANTGIGYNSIITDLGDHSVPEGWIQHPKFNGKGDVPGPPIQWCEPESPDNAQPGYGYIANDTTKEETFFYHSDHLGSTSYITDDHANITQYDAYLPYGELLVDEHSSSEELPYKFNGKQFDDETGLYYYGARYMNPVTSLWYGVDPLVEKYLNIGSYVYCAGNPVKLKDTDGRKIVFVTGSAIYQYYRGNFWRANIGKNGKIYRTNVRYNPSKQSINRTMYRVLAALRKIESSGDKKLSGNLKHLSESPNAKTHYIFDEKEIGSRVSPLNSISTITLINFDKNEKEPAFSTIGLTDFDIMAHEMQHMYDFDKRIISGNPDKQRKSHNVDIAEIRGVQAENHARKIEKRKLRTSYGGMPINKEDLKNENIKP